MNKPQLCSDWLKSLLNYSNVIGQLVFVHHLAAAKWLPGDSHLRSWVADKAGDHNEHDQPEARTIHNRKLPEGCAGRAQQIYAEPMLICSRHDWLLLKRTWIHGVSKDVHNAFYFFLVHLHFVLWGFVLVGVSPTLSFVAVAGCKV